MILQIILTPCLKKEIGHNANRVGPFYHKSENGFPEASRAVLPFGVIARIGSPDPPWSSRDTGRYGNRIVVVCLGLIWSIALTCWCCQQNQATFTGEARCWVSQQSKNIPASVVAPFPSMHSSPTSSCQFLASASAYFPLPEAGRRWRC